MACSNPPRGARWEVNHEKPHRPAVGIRSRESGEVPTPLVAAVAEAFQIDSPAVRDAAFVRCVGRKLMAC
jgi:hypothetical protein